MLDITYIEGLANMRQKLCPRCDSVLDENSHCSKCNYQVRVHCPHCGHYNIPVAKFCGGCGKGTTVSVRYRKKVNSLFNPFQQIKIKRFFTGIAFGTLLALFACTSMGMKYYVPELNDIEEEAQSLADVDESVFESSILKKLKVDLDDFCLEREKTKSASFGELNAIIDIMIKDLNHIAYRTNKNRKPLDSANEYLEQQRSIKKTEKATRGTSCLMFFAYISDLLDLKYKDFAKGSIYTDIPKFNLMEAPSTALKKHNIKIASSEERFGVNEEISLGELCDAAEQVAVLAVQRASDKAPDLVAPPQIIID